MASPFLLVKVAAGTNWPLESNDNSALTFDGIAISITSLLTVKLPPSDNFNPTLSSELSLPFKWISAASPFLLASTL